MPIDVLTTPDSTRIQGAVTIINDPNGNNGTLTVAGLTTVSSGLLVTSGLFYDMLIGGLPAATTNSQQISGTNSTITMTSQGRIIFLGPVGATNSVCVLSPTGSASATNISFTNGMDVVLVNVNPTLSNVITIPSGSTGVTPGPAVAISGGQAARFIWVSALSSWVHTV